MANRERFALDDIAVDRQFVKDTIRVFLHTIMFNRTLGIVRPVDVDIKKESLHLTYVQCGDFKVERSIDDIAAKFIKRLDDTNCCRGTICLSFFETTTKRSFMIFKKEEKLVWEQWMISLRIRPFPPAESEARSECLRELSHNIQRGVHSILKCISEKTNHIPRITDNDSLTVTFPYEVSCLSEAEVRSSGGDNVMLRLWRSHDPSLLL